MLLLFWYLPLILFSGVCETAACETIESRSEQAPVRAERHLET
jgi:hypothetical protein